jgi:hypothetical protein
VSDPRDDDPPRRESSPPRRDESTPRRDESTPPPPERDHGRRLFERAVPHLVKRVVERAVESGVEKLGELSEKPDELRNLVRELRLPKEVLSELFSQVDDTKTGLYRVVAKEIRDVLEHTQIADEIVKVLTKLSFEIKTEIRFVPNDRSAEASDDATGRDDSEGEAGTGAFGLRPKVTADVSVKERGRREGR